MFAFVTHASCMAASLFVRTLKGIQFDLSATKSENIYCLWQDLSMHWPLGQKVQP